MKWFSLCQCCVRKTVPHPPHQSSFFSFKSEMGFSHIPSSDIVWNSKKKHSYCPRLFFVVPRGMPCDAYAGPRPMGGHPGIWGRQRGVGVIFRAFEHCKAVQRSVVEALQKGQLSMAALRTANTFPVEVTIRPSSSLGLDHLNVSNFV